MIQLADRDSCTGCGACSLKCPKHCITMSPDDRGIVMPVINHNICVECHSCEKVCPILFPIHLNHPQKAYASWTRNEKERCTSASGGVAAEFYKFALKNGYKIVGAVQNDDFSVSHIITDNNEDLIRIKNSKYVASDFHEAFLQIEKLSRQGYRILFIGLPCQVAALRKLVSPSNNMLLAEVVCHGTTPYDYLKEHIRNIEKKEGKKAAKMFFRDPKAYTYTYTFTLYDKDNRLFYARTPKENDKYQFGYHCGITYRENCYHCIFARKERVADITLGDYKGLGTLAPCTYNSEKVSCVLLNTEKGISFFDEVFANKTLHADLRPLDEPINGDRQLQRPTYKIPERYLFERLRYRFHYSYTKAIFVAYYFYKLRMLRGRILKYPKKLLKAVFK